MKCRSCVDTLYFCVFKKKKSKMNMTEDAVYHTEWQMVRGALMASVFSVSSEVCHGYRGKEENAIKMFPLPIS